MNFQRLAFPDVNNFCNKHLNTKLLSHFKAVHSRAKTCYNKTLSSVLKSERSELQCMRSRSDRASDEVSRSKWHNQLGKKNKGLLESLSYATRNTRTGKQNCSTHKFYLRLSVSHSFLAMLRSHVDIYSFYRGIFYVCVSGLCSLCSLIRGSLYRGSIPYILL